MYIQGHLPYISGKDLYDVSENGKTLLQGSRCAAGSGKSCYGKGGCGTGIEAKEDYL